MHETVSLQAYYYVKLIHKTAGQEVHILLETSQAQIIKYNTAAFIIIRLEHCILLRKLQL